MSSEVSKATMPVAVGGPSDQAYVTKIVLYTAFSTTPATPVRRKVMGRIRYGDASES
jgi:hypothetical protein